MRGWVPRATDTRVESKGHRGAGCHRKRAASVTPRDQACHGSGCSETKRKDQGEGARGLSRAHRSIAAIGRPLNHDRDNRMGKADQLHTDRVSPQPFT